MKSGYNWTRELTPVRLRRLSDPNDMQRALIRSDPALEQPTCRN